MLGYVTLGADDLERAYGFYDAVLAPLGAKRIMPLPHGAMYGVSGAPGLGVVTPYDGGPASGGNGPMPALSAPTRAAVDEVHAKALELGGADEGAPGIRGDNLDGFYGAYFRDLDGNKLCVFRFGPA